MKSHFAQRCSFESSVLTPKFLSLAASLTCFFVSVSRPVEMAQTSLMHLLKGIYTCLWNSTAAHKLNYSQGCFWLCRNHSSVLTYTHSPCKSKSCMSYFGLCSINAVRTVCSGGRNPNERSLFLCFGVFNSDVQVQRSSRGCICVLRRVSSSKEL